MELLINTVDTAKALRERRVLDRAAHAEGREHQAVDPDAMAAEHGTAEYVLTSWERSWVTERVNDAHLRHLAARNDGRSVLSEEEGSHVAREIEARALAMFGDTHEQTRVKLCAKRAEHQFFHDEAHLIENRKTPDGLFEKIDDETLAAVRKQMVDSIAAINAYVDPGGLIDRHIATVRDAVATARAQAQWKIDECEKVLAVSYDEHLAHAIESVTSELRAPGKSV